MEKRVQRAFLALLPHCPTASQATPTTSFTSLCVFGQQCVVGRAHAQSRRHSCLLDQLAAPIRGPGLVSCTCGPPSPHRSFVRHAPSAASEGDALQQRVCGVAHDQGLHALASGHYRR